MRGADEVIHLACRQILLGRIAFDARRMISFLPGKTWVMGARNAWPEFHLTLKVNEGPMRAPPPPRDMAWLAEYAKVDFWQLGDTYIDKIKAGGERGALVMNQIFDFVLLKMGANPDKPADHPHSTLVEAFIDGATAVCPAQFLPKHHELGRLILDKLLGLGVDDGGVRRFVMADTPAAQANMRRVHDANAAARQPGDPRSKAPHGYYGKINYWKGHNKQRQQTHQCRQRVLLTRQEWAETRFAIDYRECDGKYGPVALLGRVPRGAHLLSINGVSMVGRSVHLAVEQLGKCLLATRDTLGVSVAFFYDPAHPAPTFEPVTWTVNTTAGLVNFFGPPVSKPMAAAAAAAPVVVPPPAPSAAPAAAPELESLEAEPTVWIAMGAAFNRHVARDAAAAHREGSTLLSDADFTAWQQKLSAEGTRVVLLETRRASLRAQLEALQASHTASLLPTRGGRARRRTVDQDRSALATNSRALEVKLQESRAEHARLTSALSVQRNVRAVRAAWIAEPLAGDRTLEGVMASVRPSTRRESPRSRCCAGMSRAFGGRGRAAGARAICTRPPTTWSMLLSTATSGRAGRARPSHHLGRRRWQHKAAQAGGQARDCAGRPRVSLDLGLPLLRRRHHLPAGGQGARRAQAAREPRRQALQ
jgi:hypothetical protein